MRASPWSCVCGLALGCAHAVSVRPVDAPVVTSSPPAPRVAFAQLAMDDARVCVVAHGEARCGSISTGEALPLWREAPPSIAALALGFRVCALTAAGPVCATGAGEDRVARALPVEGPAGGLVLDGVHARVCVRVDARVACVDDRDAAETVFDDAASLRAGYAALWGTDGGGRLWCEGEGLCARVRGAGGISFDDDAADGWTGRRMSRVRAGRVEGVGPVEELAVDGGMICAREAGGRVWCAGELFAPTEVRSMRGAHGLTLLAARVCVREAAGLRCVLPGAETVRAVPLDGAVSLATRGDRVCVLDGAGSVRCARFSRDGAWAWRAVSLAP